MMPKFDPDQLDHLLKDITALEDADLLSDAGQQDALLAGIETNVEPMAPSPELRDRLLAAAAEKKTALGFAERLCQFFKLDLKTIQQHLSELTSLKPPYWEAAKLEGVWLKHFDGGPGLQTADCGFIYMQPGTSAPRHRHLGNEWMMVIQGEALTDDDQSILPGDLLLSKPDSCHAFSVVGTQPLVFAVIVFAGIDWRPD